MPKKQKPKLVDGDAPRLVVARRDVVRLSETVGQPIAKIAELQTELRDNWSALAATEATDKKRRERLTRKINNAQFALDHINRREADKLDALAAAKAAVASGEGEARRLMEAIQSSEKIDGRWADGVAQDIAKLKREAVALDDDARKKLKAATARAAELVELVAAAELAEVAAGDAVAAGRVEIERLQYGRTGAEVIEDGPRAELDARKATEEAGENQRQAVAAWCDLKREQRVTLLTIQQLQTSRHPRSIESDKEADKLRAILRSGLKDREHTLAGFRDKYSALTGVDAADLPSLLVMQ